MTITNLITNNKQVELTPNTKPNPVMNKQANNPVMPGSSSSGGTASPGSDPNKSLNRQTKLAYLVRLINWNYREGLVDNPQFYKALVDKLRELESSTYCFLSYCFLSFSFFSFSYSNDKDNWLVLSKVSDDLCRMLLIVIPYLSDICKSQSINSLLTWCLSRLPKVKVSSCFETHTYIVLSHTEVLIQSR